jgi:hypothetical protein
LLQREVVNWSSPVSTASAGLLFIALYSVVCLLDVHTSPQDLCEAVLMLRLCSWGHIVWQLQDAMKFGGGSPPCL